MAIGRSPPHQQRASMLPRPAATTSSSGVSEGSASSNGAGHDSSGAGASSAPRPRTTSRLPSAGVQAPLSARGLGGPSASSARSTAPPTQLQSRWGSSSSTTIAAKNTATPAAAAPANAACPPAATPSAAQAQQQQDHNTCRASGAASSQEGTPSSPPSLALWPLELQPSPQTTRTPSPSFSPSGALRPAPRGADELQALLQAHVPWLAPSKRSQGGEQLGAGVGADVQQAVVAALMQSRAVACLPAEHLEAVLVLVAALAHAGALGNATPAPAAAPPVVQRPPPSLARRVVQLAGWAAPWLAVALAGLALYASAWALLLALEAGGAGDVVFTSA